LEVLEVKNNIIQVKGLDMLDGTPVLDIKPHMDGLGE
jgi:tRNA (Thr-GGU) A37 N-methylase